MVKIFKLIDKRMLLLLIAFLIASPLLWGKNTYTYCLIESHYLTVYVNNIFLLCVYQYVYRLHQVHHLLLIRLNKNNYDLYTYMSVMMMAICYCLIVYISYYLFFGTIESSSLFITIIFMIVNMTMTCLECSLIYLQLGRKKRFLYLALPIFMNLIFHFTWIRYF